MISLREAIPLTSHCRLAAWRIGRGLRKQKSRGASCELPFTIDPIQRCYLHHAHMFGMLWPHPRFAAILLNRCISPHLVGDTSNLHAGRWDVFLDYDPYVSIEALGAAGELELDTWSPDWCLHSSAEEFAERTCAALNERRFVELHLNDFFVRGTETVGRRNARHHTLITGYSAELGVFFCASYLKGGGYGRAQIPRELLRTAVLSEAGSNLPSNLAYCAPIMVRSVRVVEGPKVAIDFDEVCHQLRCYGEARPVGGEELHRGSGPKRFGRAVLGPLRDYLDGCSKSRQRVNLIVTRYLWERHRVMVARFKHLTQMYPEMNTARLVQQWGELERGYHSLHLQCMAYNAAPSLQTGDATLGSLFDGLPKREDDATALSLQVLDRLRARRRVFSPTP